MKRTVLFRVFLASLFLLLAAGLQAQSPNEAWRPYPAQPKKVWKNPKRPGLTEGLLKQSLKGPMRGVEEIVFALRTPGKNGHWYANFGYWCPWPDQKLWGERGKLCALNVRTKKIRTLLDDREGSVRDPQVHYDAEKIIFSYRKGKSEYYHLYEINADGSNLRQLTDGPYDDIEPSYLPDGQIMFTSSRCNRWVNCFLTQVATLHVCEADGSKIRMISSNNEHENTPWPLPDGRVLYTRWEYIDRSQMNYHHLWTTNPDGTNQSVYYGNLNPGRVMIDAKPIPGTGKVLASFNPGHGRVEHQGDIFMIDPDQGPDHLPSSHRVSPGGGANYRDPWPFSEDCFLAVEGGRMVVINGNKKWETIWEVSPEDLKAGIQIHEPRPLLAHPRERVIPSRVNEEETVGRLILSDVRQGRKMDGVKAGEIKKLLVLESLPMPVHFQGGMRPITYKGTFTLERVLGTVPVEADGSAFVELPAMRSLFFVALDKDNNSVKRMQSFLTLQPGETTSCAGCHESRVSTPAPTHGSRPLAMLRNPSKIEAIPGVPSVIDFPRDIQPILDRHCLKCHDDDVRKGGVSLSGDQGPMFSIAYFTLYARRQVADGQNAVKSNRAPRTIGTSASKLMDKISGDHNEVRVSKDEEMMIRMWIESGAAYPGTYAALGTGSVGAQLWKETIKLDVEEPEVKTAFDVIVRRCNSCHRDKRELARFPSHYSAPISSNLLYNLSRPEKSLILLGALSSEAGGFGKCRSEKFKDGIFKSTDDPNYQTILAGIEASKRVLDRIKRFDMPGFRPREEYLREMKRYGILDKDYDVTDPIDVYAVDEKYWRSFWLDCADVKSAP